MRSTAKPAPTNARSSRTNRSDTRTVKPSPRDIYNRAGRRAAPSSKRPVRDLRSSTNKPYKPGDTVRTGATRNTRSRINRYSTARPGSSRITTAAPRTGRPRINTGTANPRLVPRTSLGGNRRSINSGLTGTRIAAGGRSHGYGGYGYGLGAVYSSWWDPYYSSYWGWGSNYWTVSSGFGPYRAGLSLWYPWYLSATLGWSSYYSNSWWDTWSSPTWSPSRYWWYPSSTYCPTYLYVPSHTVIVEESVEEAPEPAAESEIIVVADPVDESETPTGEGTSDLATKYVELGDVYFKAGRFAEAADAYARARTYAPDDAALHFVIADSAFAVGDYHFAAFLIAEGLRLDPALAAAKADKREFYGDPKLFDEHMAALNKYVADKPHDASARLVQGYNLNFSDRSTAAIAAFQRVLEIAPDHRAAKLFLEALAPKGVVEPSIR